MPDPYPAVWNYWPSFDTTFGKWGDRVLASIVDHPQPGDPQERSMTSWLGQYCINVTDLERSRLERTGLVGVIR